MAVGKNRWLADRVETGQIANTAEAGMVPVWIQAVADAGNSQRSASNPGKATAERPHAGGNCRIGLGFHLQSRRRIGDSVSLVHFINFHLGSAPPGSTESNHDHTFRIATEDI